MLSSIELSILVETGTGLCPQDSRGGKQTATDTDSFENRPQGPSGTRVVHRTRATEIAQCARTLALALQSQQLSAHVERIFSTSDFRDHPPTLCDIDRATIFDNYLLYQPPVSMLCQLDL